MIRKSQLCLTSDCVVLSLHPLPQGGWASKSTHTTNSPTIKKNIVSLISLVTPKALAYKIYGRHRCGPHRLFISCFMYCLSCKTSSLFFFYPSLFRSQFAHHLCYGHLLLHTTVEPSLFYIIDQTVVL